MTSNSGRTPANGLGFCRGAIARVARRTARGLRSVVIFDVDNTLADTRPRTQAAAAAFSKRGGPELAPLAQVPLHQVGWDGGQTARRLGLDRGTTTRFHRFWDTFFWRARSFRFDKPIRQTIQLARWAKAAGADVLYLTGRVQSLQGGTIRQLRRLGLPDADPSHVLCKPSMALRTAVFKQQAVHQLGAVEGQIIWFMSDSRSDIRAVQQHDTVPCVWVDFPARPPGRLQPIDPSTPTIRIR